LILAITIPNLGRIDVATQTARYGWPDAVCIAVIVAPLVLILAGINRFKIVEGIGWGLLIILLALRFTT
jgi:hypothetical protein